ncbi:uncharacterized protein LOC135221919 [Macrobrachium nipponense]|uniref:uncharacterized protein LOC135221919 n=1 Tax=Macrobrachium nipponense TaxID=159736 RepID=UPI0030C7A987
MSGSGKSVTGKVKVSASVKIKRNNMDDNDVSAFELMTDEIKIEEENDTLDSSEAIEQKDDDDGTAAAPVNAADSAQQLRHQTDNDDPSPADGERMNVDVEEVDETTQEAEEVLGIEKDSDVEDPTGKTTFRISKVYSVAKEEGEEKRDEEKQTREEEADSSSVPGKKSEPKTEVPTSKTENKKSAKDEKLLKPKTTMATLAKVPTLTGGVRLLSGGVRGTNMPLLVSMTAGSTGIPLFPAGLPPGRYVILPGTSATTKTTCATVNTTSASMAPRLATGVTVSPPVAATAAAAAVVGQATSVAAGAAAVPAPAVATAVAVRSITPTLQVPPRQHTRERGRRKSYTTGEKLAMIEAVEAGQRKSTVADRFGVAPSTLACILLQKHKIRAEQDNLTRRRFRHVKYAGEEGGRRVGTTSRAHTSITPTLHSLTPSQDQPFTHFLASLTGPTPAVIDTQPEEIIAVPDLMERIEGGTGSDEVSGGEGADGSAGEGKSQREGETEEDDAESGVECLGVVEGSGPSSMDVEYQQGSASPHEKPSSSSSGVFARRRHPSAPQAQPDDDAVDDAFKQDIADSVPSPTSQGLTGPYLLKKEAHCTTVLDQLLRDDTFTDVTLTAEGQSLRAHRIVLCLASSYFRQVLSREQNVQSVVLLRDVKFAELRNIIHFIYTGEATVDATDLESFLRTAEMLEITSLSEGQKYISNRGPSQAGAASGFSIGDFERLVGAKRPNGEAQSPTRKSQKVSDENSSSRSPSAEPTAISSVPLVLMKEDPDNEPPSTSRGDRSVNEKSSSDLVTSQESFTSEIDKPGREVGKTRRRRNSSESIGGFAAIAGVHKTSEVEDEVFSQTPKPECQQLADHDKSLNSEANNISLPGRCPYCPHVNQQFEGVAMMRHLLVSHPCKPAFPCSFCWRVFVKRSHFKSHLLNCQQSY